MIARTRQREWLLRLATALLAICGLALCYSLPWQPRQHAAAPIFFLVLAVCGTFVLTVRGLGARRGMILGLLVGFVAAIGLSRQYAAPMGNLVAFVTIATMTLGFLGHLAGGWAGFVVPRLEPDCGEAQDMDERAGPVCDSPVGPVCNRSADMLAQGRGHATHRTVRDRRSGQQRTANQTEEILGAIVADFCDWVESDAGRQCCMDASDWSGFDQFVRTTLREQLGAAGIRIFRVGSDGERLKPLTRNAGTPEQWLSTRAGLIGHVVTSSQVYVAGDSDQGTFIADLAEPTAPDPDDRSDQASPAASQRWVWLLPLRVEKHTAGLVAVRRVDKPGCRGVAVANVVRNQLQLFWAHLAGLQALNRHIRMDCQSGMLQRVELLSRLDEVVRLSVREGEPVMVLAMAIEGLRHLDDTGQWSERDALVQQLGVVLHQKVRSDDLLGRFADDRFIVVLRRLDSALGTLVAEKLLETVRTNVLPTLQDQADGITGCDAGGDALRIRAGLAGTGVQPADRDASSLTAFTPTPRPTAGNPPHSAEAIHGRALLERALGLLDYARQQRIEIATDLMKGLPASLERVAGEPSSSAGPPSPASAPSTTGEPVP